MKEVTLANGSTFDVFDDAPPGSRRYSPWAGKLRTYTSVGGYPIFYLDAVDNVLCSGCATESIDEYEEGDDVRDLPKVGAVNWESVIYCDQCSEQIEAAHGEEG